MDWVPKSFSIVYFLRRNDFLSLFLRVFPNLWSVLWVYVWNILLTNIMTIFHQFYYVSIVKVVKYWSVVRQKLDSIEITILHYTYEYFLLFIKNLFLPYLNLRKYHLLVNSSTLSHPVNGFHCLVIHQLWTQNKHAYQGV